MKSEIVFRISQYLINIKDDMLLPVGGGALVLGDGGGEGEARAALYLGNGDGIFTEIVSKNGLSNQ